MGDRVISEDAVIGRGAGRGCPGRALRASPLTGSRSGRCACSTVSRGVLVLDESVTTPEHAALPTVATCRAGQRHAGLRIRNCHSAVRRDFRGHCDQARLRLCQPRAVPLTAPAQRRLSNGVYHCIGCQASAMQCEGSPESSQRPALCLHTRCACSPAVGPPPPSTRERSKQMLGVQRAGIWHRRRCRNHRRPAPPVPATPPAERCTSKEAAAPELLTSAGSFRR